MTKYGKGTSAYESNRRYQEKKYYRTNAVIPIELKPDFDKALELTGLSRNAFMIQALTEKIDSVLSNCVQSNCAQPIETDLTVAPAPTAVQESENPTLEKGTLE